MEFDLFKWIVGGIIAIGGWILKIMWNKIDKLEDSANERSNTLASVETKLDVVSEALTKHMDHEENTQEHVTQAIQEIKIAIAVLTEKLTKKD